MIKFRIFQTKLKDKILCLAKVKLTGVLRLDGLIRRCLNTKTSRSEDDLVAAFTLFSTAIREACLDGYAVHLNDLVRFEPVVQGCFENTSDKFVIKRNSVRVRAIVAPALNKCFEHVKAQKLAPISPRPVITTVHDIRTGSFNRFVSRQNIICLNGANLRFSTTNPQDGLRFIDANQPATEVRIKEFQRLSNTQAVFLLPDVEFSRGYFQIRQTYDLSVRTGQSDPVDVVATPPQPV